MESLNMIAAAVAFLQLILANKVLSDSTFFSYDSSFWPTPGDLTYQGDAHRDSGNVRLTTAEPNKAGRVLYSKPVVFWQPGRQASFETAFTFDYKGIVGVRDPADGLTFFIIPVNSPIPRGSNGGNFAIYDPLTGLAPSVFAVEFDIFYKGNEWDPSYAHLGININSRVSRNVTRLTSFSATTMTARINYDSSTRMITVFANCYTFNSSLSYVIDLKTVLPQQVQVGISASTGENVADHDLSSWSFASTLVWDTANPGENQDQLYLR